MIPLSRFLVDSGSSRPLAVIYYVHRGTWREHGMISRGDLVKMRLSIQADPSGKGLRDIFILGRIRNYCEEEDTYIVEPRMISVPKDQVSEIERLPEDFDFNDVSLELSLVDQERPREEPPDITDIRFPRER
jgi:hypothetical protein